MTTPRHFAQQARRDRERQQRQAAPQTTNFRLLAQSARRNREFHARQLETETTNVHLAQQARRDREHEPIARRPLAPQFPGTTFSRHHRLGRCDIPCGFCGANHWIEERAQGCAKSTPRFSTCCESGAIMMDEFEQPPEPLLSLLMDLTPGTMSLHYLSFNTDNHRHQ